MADTRIECVRAAREDGISAYWFRDRGSDLAWQYCVTELGGHERLNATIWLKHWPADGVACDPGEIARMISAWAENEDCDFPFPWTPLGFARGHVISDAGYVTTAERVVVAAWHKSGLNNCELGYYVCELGDGWRAAPFKNYMFDSAGQYRNTRPQVGDQAHETRIDAVQAALRALYHGCAAEMQEGAGKAKALKLVKAHADALGVDLKPSLVDRTLASVVTAAEAALRPAVQHNARCEFCGGGFHAVRKTARFCGNTCRTKSHLQGRKRPDGIEAATMRELPVLLAEVAAHGIAAAAWAVAPGGFILRIGGGPKAYAVELGHPDHPLEAVRARALPPALRATVSDAFAQLHAALIRAGHFALAADAAAADFLTIDNQAKD